MDSVVSMDASPAKPMAAAWLIVIAVSLATFMEVLDTTITNVSLSHIAGTLGASQDESTWVLTSYLVANGIILPLSGWLANVMGRKHYFMMCIIAFTAASFACGAATSLAMIIAFRLLQGLAGGGLQPTQQAIILDSFPLEKRGMAFGITGITIIVAPILGPTLGGFITDHYSWRWIFYLNIPVGLLALWMVNQYVQDPPHAKAQGLKKIDYVGLGLIVIGLGSLQIMLDKGQQEDWFGSLFICAVALTSVAALVGAVTWLLNQKDPIVDLRLLAKPGFGISCLMIFFIGAALYSSSAMLPILTQSQFGYDATMAGLVLSPGGMLLVFLMPLSGRLTNFIQARYMVMLGFALCGIGMLMTSFLTPQSDYWAFVTVRVFQVIGLPFLFIPISTVAFMNIPKELSGKASALYSLCRNLGGSVGIALVAAYISRQQQVHQTTMAGHLTDSNPGYRTLLAQSTAAYEAHGAPASAAGAEALSSIYHEMLHQAAMLSYNDGFRIVGVILIGFSMLAWLVPRNKLHAKKDPTAAAAH